MANQELYIKYNSNTPVLIDTSYGRGPQQSLPLYTVAHLIGAFQTLPGSPLAGVFAGTIRLHPDSMEAIRPTASILKLQIQHVNGRPDLLYSEEIYTDEKGIGIEMPVDKLVKVPNNTIVLIGVSGCGKTRTCAGPCGT
ncbi:hypothetical protein HK100_008469, partial [Physocladia obscura]